MTRYSGSSPSFLRVEWMAMRRGVLLKIEKRSVFLGGEPSGVHPEIPLPLGSMVRSGRAVKWDLWFPWPCSFRNQADGTNAAVHVRCGFRFIMTQQHGNAADTVVLPKIHIGNFCDCRIQNVKKAVA